MSEERSTLDISYDCKANGKGIMAKENEDGNGRKSRAEKEHQVL